MFESEDEVIVDGKSAVITQEYIKRGIQKHRLALLTDFNGNHPEIVRMREEAKRCVESMERSYRSLNGCVVLEIQWACDKAYKSIPWWKRKARREFDANRVQWEMDELKKRRDEAAAIKNLVY